MQYLETKFNIETYINGHNFNIHTVPAITQYSDYKDAISNNYVQQFLRRRYLKVLHESFYNQTIFAIFSQCKVAVFLTKFNTNYFKDYLSLISKTYVHQFLKRR